MTDQPKQPAEYMHDLKRLYDTRLNLSPAFTTFAAGLRAALVKDQTNMELARATQEAETGALAYSTGDEETGQKYTQQANKRLFELYTFLAGAKRMGPGAFERLGTEELLTRPQSVGAELYGRLSRKRNLERQLESAKRELGELGDIV